MASHTRATPFAEAGKRTPVFVRFSTVAGERGSVDTARDARGFAVKFCTDEGICDLVGNTLNIRRLIPDGALADYERMLTQLRNGHSAVLPLEPYRTRRRTRDGRELEVLLVARVLLGPDGEPYAVGTTERALGERR